jgi:hypothetical protein
MIMPTKAVPTEIAVRPAMISAHKAIGPGFRLTARTLVTVARKKSESPRSSIGIDTTMMQEVR